MFDRETGQPLREGVVGIATFSRHEKVDEGLASATHVNYHITTKDSGKTYGLERHVTKTEHGAHKVRELRDRMARAAVDPVGAAREMLTELESVKVRIDAERPAQRAKGMLDVTQTEAQQIIDFIKGLNGDSSVDNSSR